MLKSKHVIYNRRVTETNLLDAKGPTTQGATKKGAFLDLDKTLYDGYLFYDWAKFLEDNGVISLLDFAKFQEIGLFYKLGAIDYNEAAREVAVKIGDSLRGDSVEKVLELTKTFADSCLSSFYDYTPEVISSLKRRGYWVVFVTNEPDFLAELIKDKLGADDAIGLDYGMQGAETSVMGIPIVKEKNAKFTGPVTNDLFSEFGKANVVKEYAAKNNINLGESFAMGDSEGDVQMLRLVKKAVLINKSEAIIKNLGDSQIALIERKEVLNSL